MVLFVPEAEARALLGRAGGATSFDIGVAPGASVDDVADGVKRVLRRYRVTVTTGSELAIASTSAIGICSVSDEMQNTSMPR